MSTNAAEIVAMRKQGCTLQEIGTKFDLTRERIRQICNSAGLPEYHSRAETYVNRSLIEPYLKRANGPLCISCGGERDDRQNLCADCKAVIKVVKQIKTRIRYYRETGRGIWLNQAVYMIRKYDIKPEDLELA